MMICKERIDRDTEAEVRSIEAKISNSLLQIYIPFSVFYFSLASSDYTSWSGKALFRYQQVCRFLGNNDVIAYLDK